MDEITVPGRLKLKKKSAGAKGKTPYDGGHKKAEKPAGTSTTETSANLPKKTPAQLAFDRRQRQLQLEKILKRAEKSHKERVAEFNEKLSNMTEINDIPKVSWTK